MLNIINSNRNNIPTLVLLATVLVLLIISFQMGVTIEKDMPPITALNIVLLLFIGFSAGLFGSLIGIGGGTIVLPIIHFWMGYPLPIAIGTTLFSTIFTAISGGYGHFIRQNLDLKATLLIGGAGILGVILGSWLFTFLATQVTLLRFFLGWAFILPAIYMILEVIKSEKKPSKETKTILGPRWGWVILGTFMGLSTGLFGLAGGYILVPSLIYLFGAPVYITIGTSLGAIIPLAFIGGGIKLVQGFVDINTGLLLSASAIIGAQVGSATIKRFRTSTLKLIFGFYFLYFSIKLIASYFSIMI
ncbi:sulfite exporter TauE/SafE family protein [Candidatus Bathyarchaeota archaeon]|nr:sulfite exporter TauE/SafE family protein [Candidatus Bathyarchaeota archaeon]